MDSRDLPATLLAVSGAAMEKDTEVEALRARVAELERESEQALATLTALAPIKARDEDELSAPEFGPISKADYDAMAFIGGGGIKSKDASVTPADEWGPDDIFDPPSLGKVVGEWVCITRARHDAEQAVVEAAKAFRHWCRPSSHMSPPAQALITAVDALSTSQRDRQEASDG
jgi:hypothetical protein